MSAATHLHYASLGSPHCGAGVTRRVLGTDTYDLTYDSENHLTQVKLNGSVLATITYARPQFIEGTAMASG